MQMELQPPRQLLEGVLDQECKLAIGGGSKAHKSWIFADLALALSSGTSWLNFKCPIACPVLYMNFEIPTFHFRERLRAIAKARGIEVPDLLGVWNLRGHAATYTTLEPQIIAKGTAHNAAMIVTDPLYKIMGDTDENSASDMAKLFNSLERVGSQVHSATAYAGHFSKGNQSQKSAIDRVSGSGVHGRDPDAIINFTPHKEPDAYTVDVILRCYPPVKSFVVRWEYPVMVLAPSLDPETLKASGGPQKKFSDKELIGILQNRGKITDRDEFWKYASKLKMSESTFKSLLKVVKQHPQVRVLDDGQWLWIPMPEGERPKGLLNTALSSP